jgi:hypothetical protein
MEKEGVWTPYTHPIPEEAIPYYRQELLEITKSLL